jgi:hypothetical protein
VKRVRSALDVDLLSIADGKLMHELHTDPILLADVLYVVCQPQAEAASISDTDFGRALGGDVIEHATQAMLESLADFFPSRRRELMKLASAKLTEVEAKATDKAKAMLTGPAMDEQIDRILSESGISSSSAPASQVSPPDP